MTWTYPLAVIDFEATSLDLDSFPIEIGVAIAHGPADVATWSTLVKPADDWDVAAAWDPAAERVHNIPSGSLSAGMPVDQVMAELNSLLAPIGRAWCDGGPYDRHWLTRLSRTARTKPAFQLWDIAALFALDKRIYRRFGDAMGGTKAPHRAGADAERLLQAIITTFSQGEQTIG